MKGKLQDKSVTVYLARRILAYCLDVAAVTLLYSFFTYYLINQRLGQEMIIQNQLSGTDRILYSFIALICLLVWIVVIPVFHQGKTIGKSVMRINVMEEGRPIRRRKIIIRQFCFLFLMGGFLNPCYGYLVDLLILQVHGSLGLLQTIANGFSVFCICGFLFTKSHRTWYDKFLHVQILS